MAHESLVELECNENKISLIDCYRVALDFGLPAAERALERLAVALPQSQLVDTAVNSSYRIPD